MQDIARNKNFRSQSAMEYLMTYGWSILIIAVVLGALFQLGVFGSANLGPRAQTGNCRIFRAAGVANLLGTCTGVPPQYAAQFNGASSLINLGSSSSLNPPYITISGWVNPATLSSSTQPMVAKNWIYAGMVYFLDVNSGGTVTFHIAVSTATQYSATTTATVPSNQWTYLAATFDGTTGKIYINGVQDSHIFTASPSNTIASDSGINPKIGNDQAAGWFGGQMADVQIYNASLDANQVQALYLKGIGAAPIDPNHIVGWWPLNGDVNDYSGNNNNGAATSVIYTGSWASGYTPP
jgi:Concanavalin A-like lectin/glucanases superfamily